ncbi:membrane protein insertion efficiency factor YidD [Hyphococcus lacteus]|uniref:Putative membrane protein insertion efficiency factor n=1 Tax=Hyphococcus lacteus TaxID=3143536 RepID=A0ABV3Z1C8_9PROT
MSSSPSSQQHVPPSRAAGGIAAKIAQSVIWVYRRSLSPVLYFFGARCRHEPSCSQYASEAFARHRLGRAFWLSFSRLLRCHPFGSSGYDPVPSETPAAGWRFWRLGDWSWTPRNGAASTRHDADQTE